MYINNISATNSISDNSTNINKVINVSHDLLNILHNTDSVVGTVMQMNGKIVNITTQYGDITLQMNEKMVVNQNINISMIRGNETDDGKTILQIRTFDALEKVLNVQNQLMNNDSKGNQIDFFIPSKFWGNVSNANNSVDVETRAITDGQGVVIGKENSDSNNIVNIKINNDINLQNVKIPNEIRSVLLQNIQIPPNNYIIPKGTQLELTVNRITVESPKVSIHTGDANVIQMKGELIVQNRQYNTAILKTILGEFYIDGKNFNNISELLHNTGTRDVMISVRSIAPQYEAKTEETGDKYYDNNEQFKRFTQNLANTIHNTFKSKENSKVQDVLKLLASFPNINTNDLIKQNINTSTLQNIPMPLYNSYHVNGGEIYQILYNCAALILLQGKQDIDDILLQKWRDGFDFKADEKDTTSIIKDFNSIVKGAKLMNSDVKVGEWQMFFIPLFDGTDTQNIKFFIKSSDNSDDNTSYSKRFIIELPNIENSKHLMDCLFVKKSDKKEFNIIMRMESPLSPNTQEGIEDILKGVSKTIGIDSKISFILQKGDYSEEIMQRFDEHSIPA